MLRVVLDTGVFVSGFSLKYHGSPAGIVERFVKKEIHVVTSNVLLAELERVLNYPRIRKHFRYTDQDVIDILVTIKEIAQLIDPQLKLDVIKEDPADDRILECAVEEKVDYIVSSNKHHLVKLGSYQGIPILLPTEFLQKL